MIKYPILKSKWCGTDLKFSAPYEKDENWFCGKFCEISKNVNDLSSKNKESEKIINQNIWTNLLIKEDIASISNEDLI